MKPILSQNIRMRYPDLFSIDEGSIVDDFCYFSTQVKIGKYTHIANGCSIAGGKERLFQIGDFCSLSAGVKIWCTSDDFVNDIVTILPPGMPTVPAVKDGLLTADVVLGSYTAVGSNSVIMPGVIVPEGTTIGAMSFVAPNQKLKPWFVYAGVPARAIKPRNKENVLKQVDKIQAYLLTKRQGG